MRLKPLQDDKKPVEKITPVVKVTPVVKDITDVLLLLQEIHFIARMAQNHKHFPSSCHWHLISVRVAAPWLEDSSAPCFSLLQAELLPLCSHPCSGSLVTSLVFHSHLCPCWRFQSHSWGTSRAATLLHLLKNIRVRKRGLPAHFVCCRFEVSGKCL